jgi:hypothetical protein
VAGIGNSDMFKGKGEVGDANQEMKKKVECLASTAVGMVCAWGFEGSLFSQ